MRKTFWKTVCECGHPQTEHFGFKECRLCECRFYNGAPKKKRIKEPIAFRATRVSKNQREGQ